MAFSAKLIDIVQLHPILYNSLHPHYRDNIMRDKVWDQIGKQFNEDGSQIKKKWKNIKDSYIKYLRSMNDLPGSTARKNYKNWQWSQKMEPFKPFFLHIVKPDLNDDQNESNDCETRNEPENAKYESSDYADDDSNISEIPTTSETVPNENQIKRTNQKNSNQFEHEPKRRQNLDHIDLIFQSYAQALKMFSPRRQAYTKIKIAELMAHQELQHHEEQARKSSANNREAEIYSRNSDSEATSDIKIEENYL